MQIRFRLVVGERNTEVIRKQRDILTYDTSISRRPYKVNWFRQLDTPQVAPRDLRCQAEGRSVAAKSLPTKRSGSLARRTTAYERQSPKLRLARCRPRPNRR